MRVIVCVHMWDVPYAALRARDVDIACKVEPQHGVHVWRGTVDGDGGAFARGCDDVFMDVAM